MSAKGPKNTGPEIEPQAETLEEKIERTAAIRDEVTNKLLSELIPESKSPRKFITDACKFAGIRPPQPHDSLAPFVYQLQKNVCKFPETDNLEGCDGKCGPITFNKLIEQIPQLKVFSKEVRTAPFKDQRRELASTMGSSLPDDTPETNPELPKIKPENAVAIGDSLTYGVGTYFYKGTKKFGKYNREYFKIGRSVVTGRKLLEKQLPALKNKPAYTVWLGTNDLGYRSADRIFSELEKIYTMLLNNNPNGRIVAITLLPHPKYQHKIDEVNRRIKEFARTHSSNMSVIDLHDQVIKAQQKGHSDIFYGDGVHIKEKYSQAISKMLKDHLASNQNHDLTDYL
jgi:lysophospholipase L1-like esterase